jgi:hypothetical protein
MRSDMKLLSHLVALLALFATGCANIQSHEKGITLATAQRFHAALNSAASFNGFECEMSGFPVWGKGGLEPDLGPVGEWGFFTPVDPDRDGRQDASQEILVIRLAPSSTQTSNVVLLTWEEYDVTVVRRTEFEQESGSTDALLTALKELNTEAIKAMDDTGE